MESHRNLGFFIGVTVGTLVLSLFTTHSFSSFPPIPVIYSTRHSLLISWLSVTHSICTLNLHPTAKTPPSPTLTGTLSGYLFRILADSTHRCSEGGTGNKQEVRIKGMSEASWEPLLSQPYCQIQPSLVRSNAPYERSSTAYKLAAVWTDRGVDALYRMQLFTKSKWNYLHTVFIKWY